MLLSKKPEIFSCFGFKFSESTLNFECYEKKITFIGHVFLKLLTPKDVLTYMHERACFWKPFGSERVNESQKLLKSVERNFYPTFLSFWAKVS